MESANVERTCRVKLEKSVSRREVPEGWGEGAVSRGEKCRIAGKEVPPRRGRSVRSKQFERALKIV